MATATVAYQLKQALAAALPAVVGPDVLVDWGYPDPQWPDDMVLVGAVSAQQEWRTSNRGREETLQVELHFLSWRATQQEADSAAFDLLELVDRHCRVDDPTLGGVVRECALSTIESDGYTRSDSRQMGRGTEIIATFTAHAIIRG